AIFGCDDKRHRAGSEHAAGFGLVLGHLSPELVKILEDSFGLKRRGTHKSLSRSNYCATAVLAGRSWRRNPPDPTCLARNSGSRSAGCSSSLESAESRASSLPPYPVGCTASDIPPSRRRAKSH